MGIKVEKAKATAEKIEVELKDLEATLANIESARSFEELTVRALMSVLASLLTHYLATIGRRCEQGSSPYQGSGGEHDQERQIYRTRFD